MEPDHQDHHSFISDGDNLTPEDVARIARSTLDGKSGRAENRVDVSAEAWERVARSRAVVDDIVERGLVVYGITTGFGAFKDRRIGPEQVAAHRFGHRFAHGQTLLAGVLSHGFVGCFVEIADCRVHSRIVTQTKRACNTKVHLLTIGPLLAVHHRDEPAKRRCLFRSELIDPVAQAPLDYRPNLIDRDLGLTFAGFDRKPRSPIRVKAGRKRANGHGIEPVVEGIEADDHHWPCLLHLGAEGRVKVGPADFVPFHFAGLFA